MTADLIVYAGERITRAEYEERARAAGWSETQAAELADALISALEQQQ